MENELKTFKELRPGTVLNAGKYIIEKKIGEGGFGITYKAVQTGLNRAVCIKEYFLAGRCMRNTQAKTVHLQGISDEKYEKYRQAFVKEAQTVASLRHPNIVEVIDIFDENNTSYMVMNFIEGRSLQSIVDANGPLSYPEAVNYMAQITDAVRYIHEHNILHRDIKPENIMVTADYKAILIDFGSAREFEQDKTQMHTSMLTHGYAPPEQYTANSRKGSYTDIYALGATLYYILTGKVPLEAAARLTEELVEPQRLNPSIPDEGNRTIMKAMKLKKEERYQLVQDFMNDLKNVHGGTIRDGNGGNSGIKAKRWVLWGVFAAVLLSGAAIATYKVLHRDTPVIENDDNYLQLFKTTYEDAIKEYDLKVDNIPVDRNGDYGNELLVMDVFFALQKIEQCEKDSLFAELDTNPVFEDKLFLYRKRLNEAKANIQDDIQDDLAHGMSNTHVDRMLKRIELLDNMLEMTKGTSVLDVHPPKPDIQDLN